MEVLPAVDVRAGRAVQLVADAVASTRDFGDPVEAARRWQSAGATWIHLVDLDAAFGDGDNAELLERIVDELDLAVQLSGGIVDEEHLARALATGCRRVVLGTAALADPGWCADAIRVHGDRLVIGLDVRDGSLVARGSGVDVGPLTDALRWLEVAGAARYVVTDVDRDGALSGANIELVNEVCEQTEGRVLACGGITQLGDLHTLRTGGAEGAIVGSALYEGRFTLEDAIAAAAP